MPLFRSSVSSVLLAWSCGLLSLASVPVRLVAQSAPVPALNTHDRSEVISLYRHYYLPSSHRLPGWTGNVGEGAAGALDPAYVRAILLRINYFRAMSGLPGDVVFDPVACGNCQRTALTMAAQRAVSHTPGRDWKFYTPVVAQTALRANLNLDWRGDQGPEAIDRYIADNGDENGCCGHRRWLLYNAARLMGTGSIPASGTEHPGVNVTFIGGPAPTPAHAPPSAAWPPAGFVPATLVYDRWSFSYANADFHLATVRVTKNGVPVPTVREPVRFQTRPDGTGQIVGNNTLVWTLPGNHVGHLADETYRVDIDNVYIAGERRQFSYPVTSIDPNGPTSPGPGPRLPRLDNASQLASAGKFDAAKARALLR